MARIGESFSFVFSDTTFTSSDGSSLSYSLTDPPSWLSLDSNSRQFSGTPQDGDVGPGTVVGVNITLVATDSTGSTQDDATLVVSRDDAPSVQKPLSEQIQAFGDYSEPSSILCSPEENFKFTFAPDTFADPDATELNYYSVMADSSPLPAWLSFDPGALAFAGTTPPFSSLIEPPQTFSVKLIASDVTGFSAASVNFSIVVGSHTLTTSQPVVTLNATAGVPFVYGGLAGSIEQDGKTAKSGQVNVTTRDLPTWLTFDQASWNISGTPPATAESTTFTIVLEDAYADILKIAFSVQLAGSGSLFQSTFPALTVKSGERFSFNLSSYLEDPSALDVTTNVQPATSWITWDANSLILSGDAPSSASKSVVDVTFTVASKSNNKSKRASATQSQQLVIQIEPTLETTSSSTTRSATNSPSTSTTSTPTSTAAAPANHTTASHPNKLTIIAVVISIVAVLAIMLSLCLWCCARKKKENKRHSSSTLSDPFPEETYIHTPGRNISSPELQRTTSPHDKEKEKRPFTVWKASNLRREITSSPAPAGFGLAAVYTNDGQRSAVSTPVGKIKDWFASIRSLNVVHVLPYNRRRSTDSELPDEGRSYHGALDLESAGPPVITLSHGGDTSLRDALQISHPAMQQNSLQFTPTAAYSADRRRMSRQITKGKSVQQRIPTPGVRRKPRDDADPFTDFAATAVSPISTHNQNPDPNDHPISPITPNSPLNRPSIPLPSSSVMPNHAPLRPAHSQKSLTSSASSSLGSLRGKLSRKLSAQAEGAKHALQSPKRRTRAMLGMQQKTPGRNSTRRARRVPVLEDDESALGARSASSPMSTARRSDVVSRSGGSGIAGFLSPRAWPQPAAPPARRNVTMPQTRAERHSAIIRRRPVPSGGAAAAVGDLRQSSSSEATNYSSIAMPSPLRTPRRATNGSMVSSPYGLAILNSAYSQIAASSPYSPREEEEGGDEQSESNWEQIGASSPAVPPLPRGIVGGVAGGGNRGDVRMSVAGASERSKASSGDRGAFV